jgi:hypothetical protein
LNAKLLSLADRYCAQVSARNYRRSLPPHQALANLVEDKMAPVDPSLAQHFQRSWAIIRRAAWCAWPAVRLGWSASGWTVARRAASTACAIRPAACCRRQPCAALAPMAAASPSP